METRGPRSLSVAKNKAQLKGGFTGKLPHTHTEDIKVRSSQPNNYIFGSIPDSVSWTSSVCTCSASVLRSCVSWRAPFTVNCFHPGNKLLLNAAYIIPSEGTIKTPIMHLLYMASTRLGNQSSLPSHSSMLALLVRDLCVAPLPGVPEVVKQQHMSTSWPRRTLVNVLQLFFSEFLSYARPLGSCCERRWVLLLKHLFQLERK